MSTSKARLVGRVDHIWKLSRYARATVCISVQSSIYFWCGASGKLGFCRDSNYCMGHLLFFCWSLTAALYHQASRGDDEHEGKTKGFYSQLLSTESPVLRASRCRLYHQPTHADRYTKALWLAYPIHEEFITELHSVENAAIFVFFACEIWPSRQDRKLCFDGEKSHRKNGFPACVFGFLSGVALKLCCNIRSMEPVHLCAETLVQTKTSYQDCGRIWVSFACKRFSGTVIHQMNEWKFPAT